MHILENGILIAIVAHGLIGISLVWDKVLLQQPHTGSVVNYVFWLGAMSIFGVILIPFGFNMPSAAMALLGFGAGVIHLAANYFYYMALKRGEASQTLAIMGGFSPTATALIGLALIGVPLSGASLWGFALMVGGGFFMFLAEKFDWKKLIIPVLFAAGTFGLTNVLQKIVFNNTNFVTGYVFFTIGTFIGALVLLVRGTWREQIFKQSEEATPRSKFWYFVNRFISGVGSFLVFFAISRANPAVVDAIAGVRYAIIFLGSYLLTRVKPDWLREEFGGWTLLAKSIGTALVIVGLVLVGLAGKGGGGGPSAQVPDDRMPAIAEREWRLDVSCIIVTSHPALL
jgi:uncharacterized membrane protein